MASLRPSPNVGERGEVGIDALVLHYTGMASGEAALARLLDPASEVSAHYLVWEDGRIDQLVAETGRAWHAGRSFWAGRRNLNATSIGIEIVNGGHAHDLPPYPPAQVDAVAALVRDVCARRRIPPARVLGHSDVAPTRKMDPGEHFPWAVLMGAGLAASLDGGATAAPIGETAEHLAAIGYDCEAAGTEHDVVRAALRAFQRRWRPARVDGVGDGETTALLQAVRAAHGTPPR